MRNINAPVSKSKWRMAAAAVLLVTTIGCEGPPELPPFDSMSFTEFKKGQPNVAPMMGSDTATQALTQAQMDAAPIAMGPTKNVELAALSVGLVTVGVNLALLWPRAFFWGTLSAGAERQGGGKWEWNKTFALAGWQSRLTGELNDTLDLQMFVTGLRGDQLKYQNFLWYTGKHQVGGGKWAFNDLGHAGPVITVDWTHQDASNKSVTFTNVTVGEAASGDRIGYTLVGNIATMSIHDQAGDMGLPADFSVAWDIVEGEGKMVRGAESFCWGTLAQGQIDAPCPGTAWPTP